MDKSWKLFTTLRTKERCFYTRSRGRYSTSSKFVAKNNMHHKRKIIYKQSKTTENPTIRQAEEIPTNSQHLVQRLRYLYTYFLRDTRGGKLLFFRKLLIALLFLILPWNLGKHFVMSSSFVGRSLVPYLIPTIYLQDILILGLVLLFLFSRDSIIYPSKTSAVVARIFFLFLLTSFFSIFFSDRLLSSVYFLLRIFLYFLFFITSLPLLQSSTVRKIFLICSVLNIFMLCALGFFQYRNQSSVFNNYLFFGEQPYNSYTPFIAKESYDGVAKIPPYGSFMHPNIFAGFLVILLTLVFAGFSEVPVSRRARYLSFILIAAVLFIVSLTVSRTAQAGLFLGGSLIFCGKVFPSKFKKKFVFIAAVSVCVGLSFPLLRHPVLLLLPSDSGLTNLSVERRSNLLLASYAMFLQRPFYGWGLNSFTSNFGAFYTEPGVVRFIQPVHNVFALVASETGVFGAICFLSLFLLTLKTSCSRKNIYYFIAVIQIVFMSGFDHYFFTIHQTLLLSVLTLMFALTYTSIQDRSCL